jgi:hypothetical protein
MKACVSVATGDSSVASVEIGLASAVHPASHPATSGLSDRIV